MARSSLHGAGPVGNALIGLASRGPRGLTAYREAAHESVKR